MLGFGPLGASALGALPGGVLRLTSDILQAVVTEFVDERKLLPLRPSELHHFTSLDTAYHIMAGDDVRLSHAEYSNDQTEMEEAKEIIRRQLTARSPMDPFFARVLTDYQHLAPALDAYIFCTSTGTPSGGSSPQDMLGQWRAYGQDGRGICLTLDGGHLARLVQNTPSLRINPVIYDRNTQVMFIDAILDRGFAAHQSGARNAHEAAVAALVFATPLMKAPGFAEEREWRLIFMPPAIGTPPQLGFHPRRDFLAPFITLGHIWNDLRPAMLKIPDLDATLGPARLRPSANVPPLVPVTKVMIGPSGHQSLNERSIAKLIVQANRPTVVILKSQIPYRSLA
jgi:Protein of unknown function (DUF2971)